MDGAEVELPRLARDAAVGGERAAAEVEHDLGCDPAAGCGADADGDASRAGRIDAAGHAVGADADAEGVSRGGEAALGARAARGERQRGCDGGGGKDESHRWA